MPMRKGGAVHALISASFFTTTVAKSDVAERIVALLRATTAKIEEAIASMDTGRLAHGETPANLHAYATCNESDRRHSP